MTLFEISNFLFAQGRKAGKTVKPFDAPMMSGKDRDWAEDHGYMLNGDELGCGNCVNIPDEGEEARDQAYGEAIGSR